ncbi:hypothetical protein AB833_29520 [Chromatiales bacterium (ex Bugula neritina AB1)]|nr:hypothetical protein AB833_29520 [Chromatiales bacterium (ex Bugula neritina AB1)]
MSVDCIGARSSALLVRDLDTVRPYQINALSREFRDLPDGVLDHYLQTHSHLEADAYEYILARPHQELFDDLNVWPNTRCPSWRSDFQYLSEHVGVFRRMVSRLNNNSRWFDCITFQFDNKFSEIPQQSYQQTRCLIPHMAKAVELGRLYNRLHAEHSMVLGALDHVTIGMCVLLPDGEVIVANREARRIFEKNDGIKINAANRLCCDNAELSAEIAHAVAELGKTAIGENLQSIYKLRIPCRSLSLPFRVEVMALRDFKSEIEADMTGVILTITDVEKKYNFDLSIFARAYGLTQAEKEVARLVIEGLENPEIAAIRNVKPSTVKTQLQSIYLKASVQNRIQLLLLVLKTDIPVD